ncbi:hypothetical protein [Zooshikella harenae]|uniref:TIGR04255 family protein n=1 Tax=Zooshikella harenae TaxID=2827238 RepID=A0ABS5ZJ75_9GAMM|nr:hypothetical protein [Zooshikella harenae]MBU2714131.1 hypothetical protein [Zooshikella harenae]
MAVVPWEFDLSEQNAIEVKLDYSGYISPAKAKIIALEKMFKVATISAEFDDEIIVYDPMFLCSKSNGVSIEFVGLYHTGFELDAESLPDICIRRSSWETSFGSLPEVCKKLSCQTSFICSKDDLEIETIMSMFQDVSVEKITTLSRVSRGEGNTIDTFEFSFSSELLTLNTSYFYDSCSNVFVESAYQKLIDYWNIAKINSSFVPDNGLFKISYN